MSHRFAITFIAVIYVLVSSMEYAFGCENELERIVGTERYQVMCPYGDAIVASKLEMEFLGKLVPVGTAVDCVRLNNGMWETRTWDHGENRMIIRRWDPKEYEVYTADGHLVPTAKGYVLIEQVGW